VAGAPGIFPARLISFGANNMLKIIPRTGSLIVLLSFLTVVVSNAADDSQPSNSARIPVIEVTFGQMSKVHARLQQEVEAGNLSLAEGQKADSIWIALQEHIFELDAEKLQLENRIMGSSETSRLKAIRQLSRNAAKRERLIISAYFALKSIMDDENFNCDVSVPNNEDNEKNSIEPPAGKSTIKIELQPTDALMKDLE
jgi:hypothetical protein